MRHLIAVCSETTNVIESIHLNYRLSDEALAFEFSFNHREDLIQKSIFIPVALDWNSLIGRSASDFEKEPLNTMEEFVRQRLLAESPISCNYKVGDSVVYTNFYGVVFHDLKVIGFNTESFDNKKFIYLDGDSYWMPVAENEIRHKRR
jgi:hypothetical protein